MGTASHVVVGGGKAVAPNSSPYGAGRRDPAAQQDIDQVIADGTGLVGNRHTLRQVVHLEGDGAT